MSVNFFLNFKFIDKFEELLNHLNVLDPNQWQQNIGDQYDDCSVRRTVTKFQ